MSFHCVTISSQSHVSICVYECIIALCIMRMSLLHWWKRKIAKYLALTFILIANILACYCNFINIFFFWKKQKYLVSIFHNSTSHLLSFVMTSSAEDQQDLLICCSDKGVCIPRDRLSSQAKQHRHDNWNKWKGDIFRCSRRLIHLWYEAPCSSYKVKLRSVPVLW